MIHLIMQLSHPQKAETLSCPFFSGKNIELLHLYAKYKKSDQINESVNISCINCTWSIHSKTVLVRMLRVGNHQKKTARHVIFVLIFPPSLKHDSEEE